MSSQQQKLFDPVAEQSQPDGSFDRRPSSFRNAIEKGGLFEPEKGDISIFQYLRWEKTNIFRGPDRYHLYVSYGCRESLFARFCLV